ncbi:MAG: hypothetical protein Q9190_006521 [Brigantiaea leucoxantha]
MATIKAIEGRSVRKIRPGIHQIQSGQVIIDLCSVVKELVENSLDAGATSVEIRFKSNGLESIEVQDNGAGISSENYETIALKHFTSKISSYDDLGSLQTYGFRGEALSSLCALSQFSVTTAQVDEAPRGTRLDFESSGKLKTTSTVASQKGTTVVVENLFFNLPVRRRELEKNIKREYGKVLGVLQAYACISTQVKFVVSNVMTKGRKAVVFATKSNLTTRENIANVFGAKMLPSLVTMSLNFSMEPSQPRIVGRKEAESESQQVQVLGHVSRPAFGEGRQTPDRQMFYVNSRPCGLPQVAKVFNEVYKVYNTSQSPFIFANIALDTSTSSQKTSNLRLLICPDAYDVNVSPDKRTILLHDQTVLLESLRVSLTDLFEQQDHTVPQTHLQQPKLPSLKQAAFRRETSEAENARELSRSEIEISNAPSFGVETSASPQNAREETSPRPLESRIVSFTSIEDDEEPFQNRENNAFRDNEILLPRDEQIPSQESSQRIPNESTRIDSDKPRSPTGLLMSMNQHPVPVQDFNRRIEEQQNSVHQHDGHMSVETETVEDKALDRKIRNRGTSSGVIQNAFDRMRPRRISPQSATITIGSKTSTTLLGSSFARKSSRTVSPAAEQSPGSRGAEDSNQKFSKSLQAFAAQRPHGTPQEVAQSIVPQVRKNKSPKAKPKETSRLHHSHSLPSDEPVADRHSESSVTSEDEDQDIHFSISREKSLDPEESGDNYVDDEDKKAKEDARVAELIQQAEEGAASPNHDNINRANRLLKGGGRRDSTVELLQAMQVSIQDIDEQLQTLEKTVKRLEEKASIGTLPDAVHEQTAEERLSLTVSKKDFQRMMIIGQFNLGFILTLRASESSDQNDEVFIIDQHASDEKFNFERLQATTTVQNQVLVRPKDLDLTAIEEEVILENNASLVKNGFVVDVDQSGDMPVGRRCKLLSLPMSKEVTFDTKDLEELIALLAESSSHSSTSTYIPRPSKVRRMFAMRACRSSVMIGKTLQKRQMERLVRHMGEIDKPWNCPHGRPTMRHVMGLGAWRGWKEGDGVSEVGEMKEGGAEPIDWSGWLEETRQSLDEQEEEDEEEEEEEEEEEDEGEESDRLADEQCENESEDPYGDEDENPPPSISQRFLFSSK